MTAVSIALRSNPARYTFAGNARLINAYAEQQGGDAKAPYAVLPCPGMVQFAAVTDTPNRGTIFLEDLGCIYSFHSSGVFKVLANGTATRIGTIPGVDQVQLSRNQADPVQISVHCGAGEYYIEADIVKLVSDVDVTGETIVTQDNVSGYTLYGASNGKFLFSGINNCNDVDGLDFATAEQSADSLKRIKANGPDVFFFGAQTIEPWRVTADLDLPFQLIGGATQQRGMIAPQAVIETDNTLMFPGENNQFGRLQNYSFVKISNHAQDRLLESDPYRESVQGFAHSFQGHEFANWAGTNWAITYDAATKFWHDRESYGLSTWRAINGVRAWGKTIVGDRLSGNLYYFDADTFTEAGEPMIWGVDCPIISAGPEGGVCDAVHIDLETGNGALLPSADGYSPKLMFSWSIDGGRTFIGYRELPIGKRGERLRVTTEQLGEFGRLGIQFRLRISDPVIRSVIGIDADITAAKK